MDPLEIAPFVSSGTGLLGGIINNIFATKNANKTNEQNLKIARETNQINKEIADQNFALQQDWNEYQKHCNNKYLSVKIQAIKEQLKIC